MNLNVALRQLKNWCDQSQGRPIEIAPGRAAEVFISKSLHAACELQAVEEQLGFVFPESYRQFMATVGACTLFSWSEHGGGPRFYTPEEVLKASLSASFRDANKQEQRFCFVGEHRLMGDLMGFLISRPSETNFDIYCHEYNVSEYAAVSDELASWRSFQGWVIRAVESLGTETI